MLRILLDPAFRRMDEIFTAADRERLGRLAEVVWAKDEEMPRSPFVQEAADVDVIVFGGWRHPEALEAAMGDGRLKALLEVAGGHHHQDLDYQHCLAQDILVGSCAPAFAAVVAEMGLTLALASVRGVVEADRAMTTREEHWLHDGNTANTSLLKATVGFVGCGSISRDLQQMLDPFDVTILGYDPPLPDSALAERGIEPVDLPDMFDRAAVIFVLAAPTPENLNLVSRRLLTRLGGQQSLVILSRGHLVDFDALADLTVTNGFRVATDVYPQEPLVASSPLRDLPGVITVPHLAGALPHALLDIGRRVTDDVEALTQGRKPTALQYLDSANQAGLLQH